VSIFDGVPEVSIAVPIARKFTYFYPPRSAGTYMYHCHFEDVEHVQMGMQGIIYVRPKQNKTGNPAGAPIARLGGNAGSPVLGYAYNDGVNTSDPLSTAYDREFTLLLNEVWTLAHDNDEAIQATDFTDYQPNYWTINGRAYPHTLLRGTGSGSEAFNALAIDDGDGAGASLRQPNSSLIQVNPSDRVLLRFADLGYQQHAMQLPGIRLHVVGQDATLLRGPTGADNSYLTNTIYLGPGEARDVLFTAPAYDPIGAISDGSLGSYNRYVLMNRNVSKLNNNGATAADGLGGMATEVRVYQNPLPPQSAPNEAYV
jgi:FtsP/CotA-like multicopper oxidase with cupredoxin domain